MFASKIVMAAIALGAVSFAAPVEKREAQVLAPPPAMLGPLGLKSIVPSSTLDAQAVISTAASAVNSVVSFVATNIVAVPTTLASVPNTKLATQNPASPSSAAATTEAASSQAASSQATSTAKVTIKTKPGKVSKKTSATPAPTTSA